MVTEEFKKAVAGYIEYDPSSGKYNEDKVLELARKCRCARSTVTRWAHGHSGPGPNVREAIIKYILEQKTVS